MPIYDYRCSRKHVTEAFRAMSETWIVCPVCSGVADRVAANRVAITLPEVDTRGLYRRFAEASAEIDHATTQVEQSTGQAVKTPNLWKHAQRRAQAMTAAGESPAVHKEQLG